MVNMKQAPDKGKRPRKKYRNSNRSVSTSLPYQFPVYLWDRETALEMP